MRAQSALVMLALALTACARMPVTDDGLGFERRQAALGAIADWDIRGGIAVDDGERAYQARFTWQQRGDELELVVSSRVPGTRSFRIAGDETGLAVELQELLHDAIAAPLPCAGQPSLEVVAALEIDVDHMVAADRLAQRHRQTRDVDTPNLGDLA